MGAVHSFLRIAVLLTVVSSIPTTAEAQPRVDLPHIAESYRPFFGFNPGNIDSVSASLPFASIRLRVAPTWSFNPRFTLTLNRDGSAVLMSSYPKSGLFDGRVSPFTYGRLSYLIEELGFLSMERDYSDIWTDLTSFSVTVTTDTSEVSVSDYGGVGPIELWAIQQALLKAEVDIEWTRRGGNRPSDLQPEGCVCPVGRLRSH